MRFNSWIYRILGILILILATVAGKGQVASFNFSQPNGACAPSMVNFTNTSSANYTSISWNFGDFSSPSNALDPSHPYSNPGVYVVTLTMTYPNGTRTAIDTVRVYQKPDFDFSKLNDSICSGNSISFTSSVIYPPSLSEVASYLWNFGDGLSDSISPVSHIYGKDTIDRHYTVSLTVTDIHGCSDIVTKNNYLTLWATPKVDFTADKTAFCQPPIPTVEAVHFTNLTSAVNANSYLWNFGDGSAIDATKNPTHTYSAPTNAKYSVKLVATSPKGCKDSLTKSNYIDFHIFESRFEVSNRFGCDSLVTFVRGMNGSGTTYFWDFGDGDTATTRSESLPHRYKYPGDYVITVYSTSLEGCQDIDTVHIRVYDVPDATFYASDTAWCDPFQPIILKNTTNYGYSDDFGLGSVVWHIGLIAPNDTLLFGDSLTFAYGDKFYDAYTISLSVTTPYGCVLVPNSHSVSIYSFKIQDEMYEEVVVPDHCHPNGWAEYVFPNFLSTSNFTKAIIYWQYPDTTIFDTVPLNGNVEKDIDGIYTLKRELFSNLTFSYLYPDTGVYEMRFHLENEDGCEKDYIHPVPIGLHPLGTFDYEYTENCYSVGGMWVTGRDSLMMDSSLAAPDSVKTTSWKWLEFTDQAISNNNPCFVRPFAVGYYGVKMIPYHNLCPGDTVCIDSVGYICPPIAALTYPPAFDPPGSIFCDTSKFTFESQSVQATREWWWYGDTSFWYGGSNSGWIHPDSNPTFDYMPHALNYLYESEGFVITNLIAVNDDTNRNSPTYNPCGYCEDTNRVSFVISIEDTIVHPTTESLYCQNASVLFYDSSRCTDKIIYWGIYADGLTNTGPFDSWNNEFSTVNKVTAAGGVISGYIWDESFWGCKRYHPFSIYVYPQSTPRFRSSYDSLNYHYRTDTICANNPDTLYFIDSSYTAYPFDTLDIISYRWWVFADTLTVIDTMCGKNLTLIDTFAGIHNVRLTIVNEAGCESYVDGSSYIVSTKVFPSFVSDADAHCEDKPVGFVSTSEIFPEQMRDYAQISYTWDFGDGSPWETYYTPNGWTKPDTVFHAYSTASMNSKYAVTLTVNVTGIPCSASVTDTVRIHKVKAIFSDNGHQYPCPSDLGRSITFTDSSIGNITWWHWNFGDTVSGTSNDVYGDTQRTVVHTYTRSGSYTIHLVVRDDIGCTDSITATNYVFIDGPQGDVDYAPLSGCLDLSVTFTPNISLSDTIIFNPDGGNLFSQAGSNLNQPFTFTYTQPYPYVPYFYLIQWVNNQGVMERCVVEWRGKDTIYPMHLDVDFTSESPYCSHNPAEFVSYIQTTPNVYIDSLIWDFGNGDKGSQPTTQYETEVDTQIVVCLKVSAKHCDSTICKEITVLPLPPIDFKPDSAAFCQGEEVKFYIDSTTDISHIIKYLWTFKDGFTSTNYPLKRAFSQTGIYPFDVKIDFNMNRNCSKIYHDTFDFLIYDAPVAEFSADIWETLPEKMIQFTDLSTSTSPILLWQWDFGDGEEDYLQNPTHSYSSSGYFTVNLLIEDQNGCQDTVSHKIIIKELFTFPNVFTPDAGGGKQYYFRPVEEKGTFEEFTIIVYDRWGVEIWRQKCQSPDCPSKEDTFWWDGTNKQGKHVVDGVYFWTVYALPQSNSDTVILNGSVTVLSSPNN
ncbi:MAG: PKD domain-containing protein [Bacteroidales bacterium]|nr:PKD domain-containing protein [Bacteroidales bacterium]